MQYITFMATVKYQVGIINHPLISHNLIRPCSLPTANCSELGEIATDEMRPRGVFDVGQLRYTVHVGR